MTDTVAIYEFTLADGTPMGCGTQVEFDYWTSEGVFDGYVIGKVLGHEPAVNDARRQAAWARIAA